MALAWQQGPFGAHPSGRFLTEHPPPARVLYAEPAGAPHARGAGGRHRGAER
jgi:hypothetical protein